jgi:hypothetical protein
MLRPAAPQDWLPAGHLAHFIHDTVVPLDLKAFYARYEGGGSRNQPFHSAMMVTVLVYAYALGVFSSRKIERRLHEDLAFRMLAASNASSVSDMRCEIVDLTGAFRSAGGWRVRPIMLELPVEALGVGLAELAMQPQARSLRGLCRADSQPGRSSLTAGAGGRLAQSLWARRPAPAWRRR